MFVFGGKKPSPSDSRYRSSNSGRRMVQSNNESGRRIVTGAVAPPKLVTTTEGEVRPAKRRKSQGGGKRKKTRTEVDDEEYAVSVLGLVPKVAATRIAVVTTVAAIATYCPWKCRHCLPLAECTPCWQVAFLQYVDESIEASRI